MPNSIGPAQSTEPTRGVRSSCTRVADLVVRTLAGLGVDTYYGIPGGAIGPVYDALLDQRGSRIVNARHESGAVFAAMGQSRVGGTLPCVLLTSGPGVTNALTGLAAAQADGIPLIAVAGEVPRKNFGRGALQEGSRYGLDLLGMVRSATKFSAEIASARATATLVRKAVATALSGRQGPAFLSLPLDVATEKVLPGRTSGNVAIRFEMDDALLDAAAAELQAARRGLILVGSGARHPQSVRWIRALALLLQIPVITTPKAKGLFPESHRLSLGVFGLGGHPSATEYLERGVDVVLCVGCGLGEIGTNGWSRVLEPTRAFIQLDIDAAQIGRNYHVDYGLVGPARLVLRRLLRRLKPRLMAAAEVSGIRYHEGAAQEPAAGSPLRHGQVIRLLQRVSPEDTIFTCDIGEHALFAIHFLGVDRPDGFLFHGGLGSMGSGIGSAVGAKLARPRRPVVALCGDHGFQMYGMELATCVDHRLGVVFAVFNDGRMRMVEHGQAMVFGRSGAMHSRRVDFAALAKAVGARGHTLRSAGDFRRLPADLWRSEIPAVLDIQIDPTSAFPVNGRIAQIRNFLAE